MKGGDIQMNKVYQKEIPRKDLVNGSQTGSPVTNEH
jgi:hypothetical protein